MMWVCFLNFAYSKLMSVYVLYMFTFHAVLRVGYEQSSYSLHEEIGYVEVCVVSSSPGIQWQFVINVSTTTDPKSSEFL